MSWLLHCEAPEATDASPQSPELAAPYLGNPLKTTAQAAPLFQQSQNCFYKMASGPIIIVRSFPDHRNGTGRREDPSSLSSRMLPSQARAFPFSHDIFFSSSGSLQLQILLRY